MADSNASAKEMVDFKEYEVPTLSRYETEQGHTAARVLVGVMIDLYKSGEQGAIVERHVMDDLSRTLQASCSRNVSESRNRPDII